MASLTSTTSVAFEPRIKGNPLLLILCFLIPLSLFIEINIVGRLFLAEIILLAFLFFYIHKYNLLFQGLTKRIFLFGFAWLIAQIISDLILQTAFEDYTRGWSKISFTLLNFAALYLLLSTEKRLLVFLIGMALYGVINSFTTFHLDLAWKMGGGFNIGLLVISSLAFFNRKKNIKHAFFRLNAVLFFGLSIVSISLNSRSRAGLLFVISVFLFSITLPVVRRSFAKITMIKLFIGFIFAIVFVWGMLSFYGLGAERNWFGEEVKAKYEMQHLEQYGAWGTLLGGRSELLVSLQAIQDSPWIGHGSWAKDYHYALLRASLLEELSGGEQRFIEPGSDLIPSHSHVFGSWVESGIIGAMFWILITGFTVYALIKLPNLKHVFVPIFLLLFIDGLWNILFSPFGAERRVHWAIYFVCLSYALLLIKKKDSIR